MPADVPLAVKQVVQMAALLTHFPENIFLVL